MFTIGEFSRATHLSVKALRHYDEIGLLMPADVDASTGYSALHSRQAVDALAQVLANAQVTVLEGQGHGALVQAPKLVADAVVDFIDRLPSS